MNISKKIFLNFIYFILFFYSSLYAACTPSGTTGKDDIHCSGELNSIFEVKALGDDDNVTLENVSGRAAYWLDESLGGNSATDGNDTFIAENSSFYWVLGFGGNDTFKVYDSNFSNLYGDTNPGHGVSQRGDDTIYVENSISNGWILGGNDSDTITIKNSKVSFVASGYSINYIDTWGKDYTPFDGNDTVILDNVDFNETNYYAYYANLPGEIGTGKGDDLIVFKNGGNAYGVSAGHGNDQIIVEDYMTFNDCNYTNERGKMTYCGIYGDEPYESEANASTIALHGDDEIVIKAGDLSGIVVEAGDGSDNVVISDGVLLLDTNISGGDDRSIVDGFVDVLSFDGWKGNLNAYNLTNFETIVFDNGSDITFLDNTLATGFETGADVASNLPYGLVLKNDSSWKIGDNFTLDGNLYNSAVVNMNYDGNEPNSTLVIKNDYSGDDGVISMDTVLNDASSSLSDKIVIEGNSTGRTILKITNINGLGGQTPTGDNEGILVVEVHGTSANDAFELEFPNPYAGEYEYELVQGSNGNWYLQSYKIAPVPPADNIVALNSSLTVNSYDSYSSNLPAVGRGTTCFGPFSYSLLEDVKHGSLVLDESNGEYSYTPNANYNGADSFSYKITSNNCSVSSNRATLSISVLCATSQSSDGGDIFGKISVLLMMFMTTFIGLFFIKKEKVL
ncbi:autotransporter [hydrothermal vent metagenome]|uniref:Autotransporter n=1 Tax=hydrothermal vent metagenome TaxID=652676 RepID=A0A1W1EE65_9ZZZZ